IALVIFCFLYFIQFITLISVILAEMKRRKHHGSGFPDRTRKSVILFTQILTLFFSDLADHLSDVYRMTCFSRRYWLFI
ncbi:hypothetical protein Q4R00_05015, partial [Morganella morganii]